MQTKAEISQKTYFVIEYAKEEQAIDKIFSLLLKLQNFISFSTTKPVRPLIVTGLTELVEIKVSNTVYMDEVEILYAPVGEHEKLKRILPPEMLFSFQAVRDTIGEKVAKWIQKSEHLEPVFNLYFGVIYNPKLYLNSRFLHLCQAIESYHRRTRKNFEMPEQEYKLKIDKILENCPNESRKWLLGKLTYGNEPNLRKRLKELFDDFEPIMKHRFKRKDFANCVVNTRNYLTHFDERLRNSALKGIELHNLTEQLKLLLQACLLREIGFTVLEIQHSGIQQK